MGENFRGETQNEKCEQTLIQHQSTSSASSLGSWVQSMTWCGRSASRIHRWHSFRSRGHNGSLAHRHKSSVSSTPYDQTSVFSLNTPLASVSGASHRIGAFFRFFTVTSTPSTDSPKSEILTCRLLVIRQFRAARSRWITFFRDKWFIPRAMSRANCTICIFDRLTVRCRYFWKIDYWLVIDFFKNFRIYRKIDNWLIDFRKFLNYSENFFPKNR